MFVIKGNTKEHNFHEREYVFKPKFLFDSVGFALNNNTNFPLESWSKAHISI